MSTSQVLPAADLLLKQFIRLAQEYTDASTPQDNLLASVSSDWRYERALQGIKLLAQHHAGMLVSTLIAWRQNVNEEIKKNFSSSGVVNVHGLCKRAAMEILFLEASMVVLDEYVPEFFQDRNFNSFFASIQPVAFRWLLHAEEYVPHADLASVRQHVVSVSARILGAVSKIRLSDVTTQFVERLDERVNPKKDIGARAADLTLQRSQLLKLCSGMKHVTLSFENNTQLSMSTDFLRKVHPLNHTAAVKKSQVHHALCEMLADVLAPLIKSGAPYSNQGLDPGLMAEWYGQILRMKNDIGQWVNKHNKHIAVGYPLVTALVCLVDEDTFGKLVDSMADFFVKQMKVKENRSLCFKCVNQLVVSFLVRHGGSTQTVVWLDKVTKPLIANARKGGIPTQEQQEFISEIADLNPEYAVSGIVLDLLQSDSTEAQIIAMRALYLIATSVPAGKATAVERSSGQLRRTSQKGATAAGRRMVQVSPQQALDLIRTGQHPFELQGITHLLPRLQHHLSLLLAQFDKAYGSAMTYNQELISKEKQPQLTLFSWVVRLIPYLRPETWPSIRPLELLPTYTAHVEGQVRACAQDALQCTVKGSPTLRNAVLVNVAGFLADIPDEGTQAIREGLVLLRNLMNSWLSLLQALQAGRALTPNMTADASAAGSTHLDLHRIEGVLFMLLCSPDETIRHDAYDTLKALRTLHETLQEPATATATGGVDNCVDPGVGPLGTAATAGASSGRHKSTMSRDSIDFMQTMDAGEPVVDSVVYLMDVLEEVGPDLVRRCYWDFGDWSDLWREFKTLPMDGSLETVMMARDEVGMLRWMRCVVELTQVACHMCPNSMAVAYHKILQKLLRYMNGDYSGRLALPTEYADGRRCDAWQSFVVVACVCPPSLRERVERAAARRGNALTARDVIKALLAALGSGPAIHQQLCLMALGNCSPEHYSILFEELPALMEEYNKPNRQKARGSARPEEMRKVVANILRMVADSMLPGTLASQPVMRVRYLDWLRDTYTFLRSVAPLTEGFWEVSQVAYCLCAVSRCVCGQLTGQLTLPLALVRDAPSVQRNISGKSTEGSLSAKSFDSSAGSSGQPMMRKLLYEMFAAWCEEGQGTGSDYQMRLSNGINQSLARMKDFDTEGREGLRAELQQSAEFLDHAARMAMAATLQGPVFDTDARRPQGPVLFWVDRLMKTSSAAGSSRMGPSKDAVAKTALFHLLKANLDMFSTAVDRCYDPDIKVATAYFQVVSEVYALHPVQVEPHVILSLVLYKMIDASPEVREDALHMLHVLSTREWQQNQPGAEGGVDLSGNTESGGMLGRGWGLRPSSRGKQPGGAEGAEEWMEDDGGSGTVVVLGALQDSYQQFQYQLSAKLARDHPELSEQLCEEMMTRQLECSDKIIQHPVLTCLAPWMENLSIASHWKGTWCERLLKSMYYVTLRHGSELPLEIERLWSTLAANKRNIIPVLDFLVGLGMHIAFQELGAMLEYFSVGKRIALYLARISPQQTIDHLVYETSLQLHEEEPGQSPLGSAHQSDGSLEFTSLLQEQQGSVRLSTAGSQALGDKSVSSSFDLRASSGLWPAMASMSASADMSARSNRPSNTTIAASGLSASVGDLRDQLLINRTVTPKSDSETSRSSVSTSGGALADSLAGISSSFPRPVSTRPTEDLLMMNPNGSSTTGPLSMASSYSFPHKPPTTSASRGVGAGTVPSSRRQSHDLPTSPALRALVTRPELALCLLTEVAYEHDEDFSGHLALLFHVALLCLDHEEPVVAQHAQQLLVNSLYSLSARYLELQQEEGQMVECRQATDLIKYLQSMKGRRLWAYEDLSLPSTLPLPSATALCALVDHIISAMAFECELKEQWADVALEWSLHARNRHLACRSQQVLRALKPPLSGDMYSTLLHCLQQCLYLSPQLVMAREVALELVLTFTALVEVLPPGKLILYPQVFWSSVALLMTNCVHIYRYALALLSTCLSQLSLQDPTVQNVLLASAPVGDESALHALLKAHQGVQSQYHEGGLGFTMGGEVDKAAGGKSGHFLDQEVHVTPWAVGQLLPVRPGGEAATASSPLLAIQQLLWKGLLFPETQLLAVQLFTQLAAQLTQLQPPSAQGSAAVAFSGRRQPGSATNLNLRGATVGVRSSAASSHTVPIHHQHAATADSYIRSSTGVVTSDAAASGEASSRHDSHNTMSHSAPELRGLTHTPQPSTSGQTPGDFDSDTAREGADKLASANVNYMTAPLPRKKQGVGGHSHHTSGWGWGTTTSRHKPPGARHIYQALMGHRHSQLLVSITAILPFLCYQLSSDTPSSAQKDDLLHALQVCIDTLAAACHSQGLPELGNKLQQLLAAATSTLPSMLPALCLQISRAFFPQYAYCFITQCIAVLILPGAVPLHPHILVLLKHLFEVPGLHLGPAVSLLVGGGLLAPITAMAQGPLCPQALDALDAIITFATKSAEVQQYKAVAQRGSNAGADSGILDQSSLLMLVLPQLDLVEMMQRILGGCGIPVRRRKYKLLPFINGGLQELLTE